MAKIKNPLIFSNYFKIDKNELEKLNLFNPVLNIDTKLFIDPCLLKKSKYKIFNTTAVDEYHNFYSDLIKLLKASTAENDVPWRSTIKLINKKEVQGTCLGYGINSTSGRRISSKIQHSLLKTAKEIIKLGIEDPDLFLLLPLFEGGIGPDTISDITTSTIENSLLKFTEEMANKLKIVTVEHEVNNIIFNIIKNPLIKKTTPILLLPKDILRHLPVVSCWDDIAEAASFNETIRNKVNKMIGEIFRAKTKKEKAEKKAYYLSQKSYLEDILKIIKQGDISSYNFEKDENSIVSWHKILENISIDHPMQLKVINNDEDSLLKCVKDIIYQFKFLLENKGINKLLWNNNTPNNEKNSQMIFFATAYCYCKANDIDISPEMDTGRGNVDFKFSQGFNKKVIVEIKLSYNQNISSGYTTQLKTYKNSEETAHGFYIIIDVGNLGNKLDELKKIYEMDNEKISDIVYIDGKIKPSASKIRK